MTREEAKDRMYEEFLKQLGTTNDGLGRREGANLNSIMLCTMRKHFPTMDYATLSEMFGTSRSNACAMNRKGESLVNMEPWKSYVRSVEIKVFEL